MKIIKILFIMLIGYFSISYISSCNKKDNRIFLHEKCKEKVKMRFNEVDLDAKACPLCERRYSDFCGKQIDKFKAKWKKARGKEWNSLNPEDLNEGLPIITSYIQIN